MVFASLSLFSDLEEVNDVIEEICNEVSNLGRCLSFRSSFVEPLVIGSSRHPSTAFCILYLLSRKRLTFSELMSMIHYQVGL